MVMQQHHHHINIIHMVVLVPNNFHVHIVIEVFRVHVIFSKTNDRIVFDVTKIVLLIHVKNVDERLEQIQKIFPTKIDIGMRNVSSVQCVKLHSLINHLVPKMIDFSVENVIINNLLPVAINAIKSSNQVTSISFAFPITSNSFFSGSKKLEYRGQQFHEHCFTCVSCSQPIGTKSFIPKDQKSYCVPCYEEHFATKCTHCQKVIAQGGVTYKNQPW